MKNVKARKAWMPFLPDIRTSGCLTPEDFEKIAKDYSRHKEIMEEAYQRAVPMLTPREKKNMPEDTPGTFGEIMGKGAEGINEFFYAVLSTITEAGFISSEIAYTKGIISQVDNNDYSLPPVKWQLQGEADPTTFRGFLADLAQAETESPSETLQEKFSSNKGKDFKTRVKSTNVEAAIFLDADRELRYMINHARTNEEKEQATALYKDFAKKKFSEAVEIMAAETGLDPEEIRDPKKRTPAQQKKLIATLRKVLMEEMETARSSAFSNILSLLQSYQIKEGANGLGGVTIQRAIRFTAIYFFAKHPDIDYQRKGQLKKHEAQEVYNIFNKLTASFKKQLNNKAEFVSPWDAFMKFVEEENPPEPDSNNSEDLRDAIRIVASEVKEFQFQLDKVNSKVWSDISYSKPTEGEVMQLSLGFSFDQCREDLPALKTTSKEDQKLGKEALVIWGLRFDDLPDDIKITKQLTPYDRLCHDAVGSLYRAGARIMTPTQIYKAMGRANRPSKRDLQKINESLSKMRAAIIYVDNSDEIKVNKSYPSFKYDGALIPFDRVTAIVNGKEAGTAIRLLSEPPLINFATQRNQYTTFPLSVWSFPLSLTNTQIQIAQYLAEQISRLKNHREYNRKLTLEKIYKMCGIDTPKKKQRARTAIETLIDYWMADCDPPFLGKKTQIKDNVITFDI